MAKFSNAKIGEEVFSSVYGKGHIINVYDKGDTPIQVKFKYCIREFTIHGFEKTSTEYVYPTLFWNEFHIPSDKEDKKIINLISLLKENLKPKEFNINEYNNTITYDYNTNMFYSSLGVSVEYIGQIYFTKNPSEVVKVLNDNKITPQQLKQAYKKLGWL